MKKTLLQTVSLSALALLGFQTLSHADAVVNYESSIAIKLTFTDVKTNEKISCDFEYSDGHLKPTCPSIKSGNYHVSLDTSKKETFNCTTDAPSKILQISETTKAINIVRNGINSKNDTCTASVTN